MAIKGKWRFGGRKPSESSGETETSGTLTPTESDGQELTKMPSRFMKTFSWKSGKPNSKKSDDDVPGHLNKPLTKQNLEHQQLLSSFAWSMGRRKSSHARSSISGVSPGPSRNASVDSAYVGPHDGERRDTHPRFSSSLIREAPQEVPGEESDREQTVEPSVPPPAVRTTH